MLTSIAGGLRRELLKPLGLAWTIDHQVLLVTSVENAENRIKTLVFRMKRRPASNALLAQIRANIAPAIWSDNGGPGDMAAIPPKYVLIAAPYGVQRQIARKYAAEMTPVIPNPKTLPTLPPAYHAATVKKLAESTTLEFIESPLGDVAEYLRNVHKVKIEFDEASLQAIGIDKRTRVTFSARGLRLFDGLQLMLDPLDLNVIVEKDAIVLTGRKASFAGMVSASYRTNAIASPAVVGRAIRRTVTPYYWDDVGGPATITEGRGALMIKQSFAGHLAVSQVFEDLSRAR